MGCCCSKKKTLFFKENLNLESEKYRPISEDYNFDSKPGLYYVPKHLNRSVIC